MSEDEHFWERNIFAIKVCALACFLVGIPALIIHFRAYLFVSGWEPEMIFNLGLLVLLGVLGVYLTLAVLVMPLMMMAEYITLFIARTRSWLDPLVAELLLVGGVLALWLPSEQSAQMPDLLQGLVSLASPSYSSASTGGPRKRSRWATASARC